MNQIKHENDAKLARMAGQIALFYRSYPEQEAVEGVAAHINKFWSGQMRQNFLAAFSGRDERLDPIVRAAFALVRAPQARQPHGSASPADVTPAGGSVGQGGV